LIAQRAVQANQFVGRRQRSMSTVASHRVSALALEHFVPPLFGAPQAPTHLDDGLALAQGDLGLTQQNDVFDGVRDPRPTALLSTRP
jgi:hypothetical protein